VADAGRAEERQVHLFETRLTGTTPLITASSTARQHTIINMLRIFVLVVLCCGTPIMPYPSLSLGAQVSGDTANLCDLKRLPADIQNRLRTDFDSWKVQASDNLSHQASLTWAGEKTLACPGFAAGFFRSAKQLSYVVLLVPSDHPDSAYRFVVFNPGVENAAYEELIVEKSGEYGASNFYIQKVPVSKFFDGVSKKKFKVQTADAILMVDSAKNEYGAVIYFWTSNGFRREPVDY